MTTRKNLIDRNGNIVGIKVETDKETFTVPVFDVRINRKAAEGFEKQQRTAAGSKYFRPSYSLGGYSYNSSRYFK